MSSKLSGRSRKINKGAPSGLVVSLIFHAAAFFVAGLFVVFRVMNPPEPEFEAPPPIERPKMKLKKPKVKVRKSSQPKPSSRIVAKVKTKEMPEIQLPDLMGTGEGLMGGGTGLGGEFLDLPEIKDLNPWGTEVTTGNDLMGVFYDFKRTRDGRKKPISKEDVEVILRRFLDSDWDESSLSRYYRSPKKLYTPCICVGTVQSTLAPEAFGETETEGWAWAVIYSGKLVYPEDIKFRFRGTGDKFNAVRVDGKVVLLCGFFCTFQDRFEDIWWGDAPDHLTYPMGEFRQFVGDWIELKAGVPVDIEVIIADQQGGLVYHQLAVEVEGEDYPQNSYLGGPCCPVFKTDNLSWAQIDALCVDVYPGDVNLTNGPVFCDYVQPQKSYTWTSPTNPPPPMLKDEVKEIRSWTSTEGETLDARFLLQAEDYVLLENQDRKQVKLPLSRLSEEDLRFVELAKPPRFKIDFIKKSSQYDPSHLFGPYDNGRPLTILDYTFGARIKRTTSGEYNHVLNVEYFAIGEEVNGDNYILLARNSSSFIPSKKNEYSHEFFSENKVRLKKYANRYGCPLRGRRMGGSLVVISDEDGRIVQYKASNEFLFENMDMLRALPVNAHFNENGERTFPARPTDADRGDRTCNLPPW